MTPDRLAEIKALELIEEVERLERENKELREASHAQGADLYLEEVQPLRERVKVLEQHVYFAEFEVINGFNQHKDGLDFDQWRERFYDSEPGRAALQQESGT